MSRPPTAIVIDKYAAMEEDFAREFLARQWGPELTAAIYDHMPRYVRAPKKGQVKGWVRWLKVERGGWQWVSMGNGRVLRPGTRDVRVCLDFAGEFSFSPDSIPSTLTMAQQVEWFGRVVTAFQAPSSFGRARR